MSSQPWWREALPSPSGCGARTGPCLSFPTGSTGEWGAAGAPLRPTAGRGWTWPLLLPTCSFFSLSLLPSGAFSRSRVAVAVPVRMQREEAGAGRDFPSCSLWCSPTGAASCAWPQDGASPGIGDAHGYLSPSMLCPRHTGPLGTPRICMLCLVRSFARLGSMVIPPWLGGDYVWGAWSTQELAGSFGKSGFTLWF